MSLISNFYFIVNVGSAEGKRYLPFNFFLFSDSYLRWIDMVFVKIEIIPIKKSQGRQTEQLTFIQDENNNMIISYPSSSVRYQDEP